MTNLLLLNVQPEFQSGLLLDEIEDKLIDSVLAGPATSWEISKGSMPIDPNQIVAIFESPADSDPETGFTLSYPGFQIRVRGEFDDYQAPRLKLEAIVDTLHSLRSETLLGTRYVYIFAAGTMIPIGQDENRRFELTQNFRTARDAL